MSPAPKRSGRRTAPSGRPARPDGGAMHPDRRLGFGLLALGAGYLAAAFAIADPEGGYAAVGPRAFPIGIGSALVALALWMAFGPARAGASPARADADGCPPRADWRAAAPGALAFLAYIALLEPLGYLPATTAFIALAARLLGSRRPGRDLIAALVVAASVHALFSLLLELRLPAGPFGGP